MARAKNKPSKNARRTRFQVRLRREEALELLRIGADDPIAAERHLRMLRPKLTPAAVEEVAWRCADPQRRGGITTGIDPDIGAYADIAVTGAFR